MELFSSHFDKKLTFLEDQNKNVYLLSLMEYPQQKSDHLTVDKLVI
jgi:hypothetical protein